MATRQELIDALNRADEAGDVEAVNAIANHLDAGDYDEPEQVGVADLASRDPFLGAVETGLSLATGAIAEPIAGLSGIAASIFGDEVGAGARAVESTREALTYQPRGQAAPLTQQGVGEAAQSALSQAVRPIAGVAGLTDLALNQDLGQATQTIEDIRTQGVGPALGDRTLDATGSPLAATAVATIPTAVAELVGVGAARRLRGAQPEAGQPPVEEGRFQDTEIPATRGEQLQAESSPDAFDQLKEEQFLLEQSGEAGDDLRAFKLLQSKEINKYLSDVAPEQAGDVGQAVKDAIDLRNNSARFKRKQAYDKLAELSKDTDVELNTSIIGDKLPESGGLRDFAATQHGQFQAISNLLTEFGIDKTNASVSRLSKQGIPITPLSVENAERFRKRLNDIEQSDQTGNTARITGPIKESMDSEFDLAAKALEESGSEDIARAAKNARQSHIALKTEFDQKGMVDRLVSTSGRGSRVPKIEESQVYTKLIANNTPIEQFDSVIKSLDRAGSKGRLAKNSIKAQMVLDLIDSGFAAGSRKIQGNRVFGATAFNKRFDQLKPKLEAVMSKQDIARLDKIRGISENLVPPSGALPKGSAGFFIDALSNAGVFALLDKIPGAGPILAEQTKLLGRRSRDAKAVRNALKNPKTKEAFDLINSDYPSLAAALGISQIEINENTENQNQ